MFQALFRQTYSGRSYVKVRVLVLAITGLSELGDVRNGVLKQAR
jgi:hypothetical protein